MEIPTSQWREDVPYYIDRSSDSKEEGRAMTQTANGTVIEVIQLWTRIEVEDAITGGNRASYGDTYKMVVNGQHINFTKRTQEKRGGKKETTFRGYSGVKTLFEHAHADIKVAKHERLLQEQEAKRLEGLEEQRRKEEDKKRREDGLKNW